jgi:hypothetical protein
VTREYFDFFERFNYWVDEDDPSEDFKFWVMAWIFRLIDSPTAGAGLAPTGKPLWFAKVPRAEDEHSGVVCLYTIQDNVVRCNGITTLSKPII